MVNFPDIVLDEPIRDDGFGGEGVDFLADGFGDELGGDALVTGFDDLPTAVATADVTLEPVDTNLVEEKESSVTEAGQQEGESGKGFCNIQFLGNRVGLTDHQTLYFDIVVKFLEKTAYISISFFLINLVKDCRLTK